MVQTYSQMSNTEFKTDTISATLRAQNHIAGGGGSEALTVEFNDEVKSYDSCQSCDIEIYDCRGNGDGKTAANITGDHENRVTDYSNCIVAKRRKYIVRRLTPLECCRLQGFPDGYADTSMIEDMTDEDIQFWENVRKTYAEVMGKTYKPCKDKKSLLKWYNGLHTDSAEYKMWGNGMCYYNMHHVIQGIVNVENNIKNNSNKLLTNK